MSTTEEEITQKYSEFQMLQQQIESLSQQMEMLSQQQGELLSSRNALGELNKSAVGSEILAPIANGIFLKGSLGDNQKLVVNVGANTTVEKTIPEVIVILEEQSKEISLKVIEAETLLQGLTSRAKNLYREVESYVQQTQR